MNRIVRISWLMTAILLSAVLAVFWWRSGRVMDEWSAVDEGNTLHAVVSFKGSLHFIRGQKNSISRSVGWDTQQLRASSTVANLHTGMGIAWQHAGFIRVSSSFPVPPPPLNSGIPPSRRPQALTRAQIAAARAAAAAAAAPRPGPASAALAPWLLTRPYDAWVVPYWALVLAAGPVPTILVMFRITRHVIRRFRGRCDACGYDLRESPERCPECGYPVRKRRRDPARPLDQVPSA